MKVALYFGSFNPIHVGHLALANYLCEFGEVDELWFVVSPHNPFKQQDDLMDDDLRLQLVQLAIKDYPKFKACDVEFTMTRPSYTYHTLKKLQRSQKRIQHTTISILIKSKLKPSSNIIASCTKLVKVLMNS